VQKLQLLRGRNVATNVLRDAESRAVSVVVEAVLDYDDVVEVAVHVFRLVCFDAHFGFFAESLPFAGERIIAVGGAITVGGVCSRSGR
jgi:hypothetical protein